MAIAPYVLLTYAVRVAVALVAAYPMSAMATRTVGSWPGGDRVLFEPGSAMLAEVFRLHRVGIEAWLNQSALVLVLMLPVGVGLNALLLAALAHEGSAAKIASRAVESLRALVGALLLYGLAGAGAIGLLYVGSEGLRGPVEASSPARDILAGSVLVAGAIVVMLGGAAHDVTRVAIVRGRLDIGNALVVTARAVRGAWWQLVAAWWVRASAGVLLVLSEIWAFREIAWLTASGATAAFVVHQAVLIALLVLRVSWFARLMELTAPGVDAQAEALDAARGLGEGENETLVPGAGD